MSANVNSFQETPENESILVLEGRLATPSSFQSPRFSPGNSYRSYRIAMSHGTQWVTQHTRAFGQGTFPRPRLGAGSRNTGKGKHRSPTILTVTWRECAPGLLHLHLERQC